MPPDTTTITASALLMSLGATPMIGCFTATDDVQSSTDLSGADYGGPEADWGASDEVYETESESESTTSSADTESTSDTGTETTTSTTEEETSTDTSSIGVCGWDAANSYYECGFEGVDPGGAPIECPPGLVEGDPCATTGLTNMGCCDANADLWYCAEGDTVYLNACG